MADLKSMKMSKTEQEDEATVDSGSDQEYPWGLQLNLDDGTVGKLGKPSLRVGDEVMIMAKAKVQRVSTHEDDRDEGSVDISMTLQITDMAVEEAESSSEEKATRMFPTMEKKP